MASRQIATVHWGSPNSPASLYGTALLLQATGEVRLRNHLMPSGTTIQEWYSFTDYQSFRGTPALPLLHPGATYRIDPHLESDPPGTAFFDVRYFDRFDDAISTEVLYPPTYEFRYPAECHHYTIRLVNGGCDGLRFTSFRLLEVADHGQQ